MKINEVAVYSNFPVVCIIFFHQATKLSSSSLTRMFRMPIFYLLFEALFTHYAVKSFSSKSFNTLDPLISNYITVTSIPRKPASPTSLWKV